MITASHNPPEYNGIKFIPENAAPALPEVTDLIEADVKKVAESKDVKKMSPDQMEKSGLLEIFNPVNNYIKAISKIIDFSAIKKSGMKIFYDALYATGRNYVPLVLGEINGF